MIKLPFVTLAAMLSFAIGANAEIKPRPGFDYLEELFPGCTPAKCVVKEDNYGGYIMPFETAMKQMVERGVKRVEVNAICNSMCASIMDRVRKQGVQVCMGPHGEFGYHKMMLYKLDQDGDPIKVNGERVFDRYDEPIQSPQILDWMRGKGGAPISSYYKTNLHLTAKEAVAQGLFPPCSQQQEEAK